jgi:hypothetical protein
VEVARIGIYDVVSSSEVNAVLGMERMKEAVGCDNLSCATEIGGALDAAFMIAGSIGRLGDNLSVSLSLYDVRAGRVERRAMELVRNDENLYAGAMVNAIVQLFPDYAKQLRQTDAPGATAVSAGATASLVQAQQALDRDARWAEEQEKLFAQLEGIVGNSTYAKERKLQLIDDFSKGTAADSPLRIRAAGLRDQVVYGPEGMATVWIQVAFTVSPGAQLEIARLRWPHFQFSALSGQIGWLYPAGPKSNAGQAVGDGVAGLGYKGHFDLAGTDLELGVMGWPLYLLYYMTDNAAWLNHTGGWSGLAFIMARPYAALNFGGVHVEVGVQLPLVWYKYTVGGFYAGLPPLTAFVGGGY